MECSILELRTFQSLSLLCILYLVNSSILYLVNSSIIDQLKLQVGRYCY